MSSSNRRLLAICALAVAGSLATATPSGAVSLEQVDTYQQPVYVTSDPGDASRLFVVELAGRIMLTRDGQTTPFLDISSLVHPPLWDRGLLSMAFAPDYELTGHLYVFYAGADGAINIDEFTASGDSADPATRRSVLTIDHAGLAHYGGQLQFGPDGYLYLSTGDNGWYFGPDPGADPLGSGQDMESLHSKMLRIDPSPSGAQSYTIPSDNPLVGRPGRDEIWSTGLRNPWRFSFDRASGDLVIADVGQDAWEEIEYAPRSAGGGRGDNYGWSCREGPDPYKGCAGDFTEPAFAYPHVGPGCSGSIMGGYVVRDRSLPELLGRYLYADYCTGEIRSVSLALPSAYDNRSEGVSISQPTSFGEDACGRLYLASYDGGVYRLNGFAPEDCDRSGVVPSVVGSSVLLKGKRARRCVRKRPNLRAPGAKRCGGRKSRTK
jgi:glucose/arabinose dehydrogenase